MYVPTVAFGVLAPEVTPRSVSWVWPGPCDTTLRPGTRLA